MKKIPLLILSLLMLSSCDPIEWMSSNHGYWYVNNMTNNTLEVAIYKHSYEKEYVVKKILIPKDPICVGTSGRLLGNRELPQFEDWLEYDSLYICDDKGNVLQKYLQENKDIEERSIFREEEWRFYEEFLGTVRTASNGTLLLFDRIWVYDIREEDL